MAQDNNKDWWQEAVSIFSEVTGLIVVPIVGSLYLGGYLDKKYNSEPWFFLGLTLVGVIVATSAISRIATRYINQQEKNTRQSNNYDRGANHKSNQ
jgi:F0F1-type ATP synthase assembly protein I